MKRYEYGLCTAVPAFATSCVPMVVLLVLYACYRRKARTFLHWLVTTIFSDIMTKKADSGLTRWFFRDIELTHNETLLSKVFVSLFVLYFMLFTVAASLFWQTLLLSVTYNNECKPNREVDCFAYDKKEGVHFWKAFPQLSDDPFNCSSPEARSGNIYVVCYEFVFNIGAASGASYGGFKLAMIIVNAITSAMLLHKRAITVTRTRIITALLFVALYASFVVVAVVQSDNDSTNTLALNLGSRDMSIYLQLLMVFLAGFSLVFYIPWKELVAVERGERVLYEAI